MTEKIKINLNVIGNEVDEIINGVRHEGRHGVTAESDWHALKHVYLILDLKNVRAWLIIEELW